MTVLLDAVSVLLLGAGLLFLAGGTVGLIRLPDLFARAHAASKCDTVGAGSILAALAIQGGASGSDLKIVLLIVLIAATTPTTAHALARSAYRTGRAPWRRQDGPP